MSPMITPPTIAKRLGVKPGRVIAWIRAGKLRAIDISEGAKRPRFRVDPDDLADFERSLSVVTPKRQQRRRKSKGDGITNFCEEWRRES